MPRIPPCTFRQALAVSPYLFRLLPVCRDLGSAQNELRWLREHAHSVLKTASSNATRRLLDNYVSRRSRGEPLQYILGSEHFGELEIKCRSGVLIPRQETAASVSHLVSLITAKRENKNLPETLHVVDLCTGTGAISLLFHNEFYSKATTQEVVLHLCGVDVSPKALELAQENQAIQIDAQEPFTTPSPRQRALERMTFIAADVLQDAVSISNQSPSPLMQALGQQQVAPQFDIVISNPPYISSSNYKRTTSASVRNYEPKLALVPSASNVTDPVHDGDIFYPRLLEIAAEVEARIVLFEVADMEQARRVAPMALRQGIWDDVEIWRDEPGGDSGKVEECEVNGRMVRVFGSGHGRSVVAYRDDGTNWLGKGENCQETWPYVKRENRCAFA